MLVDIVVFDALDEMDAWGPAEVVRSAGKRGADMQVRLVTRLRRRWSKALTAVEAARKGRRQPLEPAEAFADDVGRLSAVEAVALMVKHWSVPSTNTAAPRAITVDVITKQDGRELFPRAGSAPANLRRPYGAAMGLEQPFTGRSVLAPGHRCQILEGVLQR